MNKVYLIGAGPGTEDYLLPAAKREIENADCLVGAKRILRRFEHLDKEKVYIECDYEELLAWIKANRSEKRIAVLVSGDPGLYSFLGQLKKSFRREELAVIPGITALQLAFSRIAESWHDARVISLHGRGRENLAREVGTNPKVFLFTDSKFPPGEIARHLLDKGVGNRQAIVFENLGYPEEKITDTDLERLSRMKGFSLCVMVIKSIP